MGNITKPYQDFVNNVDVADAIKVNAQINTLYNAVNGQLDLTNISSSAYSTLATASTLFKRDSAGNGAVNYLTAKTNQNLLFNPSAHLGLNGWTTLSGGTWQAIFDSFAGGGWFQSPTVSNPGTNQSLQSSKIPMVASQAVTISSEIDTSHMTAGTAFLEIHAFDVSNVDLGNTNVSLAFGNSISSTSVTYVTPANTNYIMIRIYISPTSVGYGIFRKIKVENGSIFTFYSDDNSLNTTQYGGVLGLMQVLSGNYKFQSGSGTATIATGGTSIPVAVTFTTAFSATPLVFATVSAVGTTTATYLNTVARSPSTTGCTVDVNSGVAQAVNFNWIALGI